MCFSSSHTPTAIVTSSHRHNNNNNNIMLELALVLSIISTSLVLLFCCIGVCVVRCFRPQNSRGPKWFPDAEGTPQRVLGFWEARKDDDQKKSWLVAEEKENNPSSE